MPDRKKKSQRKSSQKKSSRVSVSKPRIKKGKVSLSPLKVITLCASVIIVCLSLLLVTTVLERNGKKIEETNSVIERFTPIEKEETQKNTDEVKKEPQKTTEVRSQKKTEVEKEPQKNTDVKTQKNTEIKKEPQKDTEVKTQKNVEVSPQKNTDVSPQKNTNTDEKKSEAPKDVFNFPKAVNNAELIFVFDDGGQNLSQLQPFLELPIPVTIAVLPKLTHSKESAERIRKAGKEVILHQPMQAINSAVNPGPGAIKPEMTAIEIQDLVQSNIEEIAPIAGMNNHEGSLITADASKISVVLDTADKNGIYFLDSRTNVDTKVPEVSRLEGYSWYERNGRFLDNEKTREEFLAELRKNLDIANKNGNVIMIAHIWSADYLPALIKEVYPELKAKGYVFKTVSQSSARKN